MNHAEKAQVDRRVRRSSIRAASLAAIIVAAMMLVARRIDQAPVTTGWTSTASVMPPAHHVVAVGYGEGKWKAGYLDARGAFVSIEDGSVIHGAYWWMEIPAHP